jgi:hypothetical protein
MIRYVFESEMVMLNDYFTEGRHYQKLQVVLQLVFDKFKSYLILNISNSITSTRASAISLFLYIL